MESIGKIGAAYQKILKERTQKFRIYTQYQSTGLLLSELLDDPKHKSLYMQLAQRYESDFLIQLAKNLQERKDIKKRGAYFMKILHSK